MFKTILVLLTVCFNLNFASAQESEATYDEVKAWLYSTSEGKECDQEGWVSEQSVSKYEIEEENAETYVFYEVVCYAGAYNVSNFYIAANKSTESGYELLKFYKPDVSYVFSDELDSVLESWELTGFHTDHFLTGALYDYEMQTISTTDKWRGLGDAFSRDQYIYQGGQWLLIESLVDPTLDGEVEVITVYVDPLFF